jgi:hypothetical protein
MCVDALVDPFDLAPGLELQATAGAEDATQRDGM